MTVVTTPFPVWNAAPTEGPVLKADAFKDALARLASGLAIITCNQGEAAQGILVSSITGLSLDPPRFLFCVRRAASAHDALAAAAVCGVSILSAEDVGEALTFVDPEQRHQRFSSANWSRDPATPPLLGTSLTAAACVVDTVIDAGTHSILIVRATRVAVRSGDPLVSFNRDMRRLEAGSGGRAQAAGPGDPSLRRAAS